MNNQEEIRKKAREFYEKRGRKDGYDLDDWLRAEQVVRFEGFKYAKEIATFIASIITILGLAWAIIQGMQTNKRVDLNTELANRPFIGLDEVRWFSYENEDWILTRYNLFNYGEKPAESQRIKNYQIILLRINEDVISKKIKDTTHLERLQYLQLYLVDERNNLIRDLMDIFYKYFNDNPEANQQSIINYLTSIKDNPEYKLKLYHKNEPIISVVEVSTDMEKYYNREDQVMFPKQLEVRGITRQMGKGGMNQVYNGNNLIVVYLAIQYQGYIKEKEYSTYYLGYADKNNSQDIMEQDEKIFHKLRKNKTWIKDSYLKINKP